MSKRRIVHVNWDDSANKKSGNIFETLNSEEELNADSTPIRNAPPQSLRVAPNLRPPATSKESTHVRIRLQKEEVQELSPGCDKIRNINSKEAGIPLDQRFVVPTGRPGRGHTSSKTHTGYSPEGHMRTKFADPPEGHMDIRPDPAVRQHASLRDPRPVGDRRTFGPAHIDDRPDPSEMHDNGLYAPRADSWQRHEESNGSECTGTAFMVRSRRGCTWAEQIGNLESEGHVESTRISDTRNGNSDHSELGAGADNTAEVRLRGNYHHHDYQKRIDRKENFIQIYKSWRISDAKGNIVKEGYSVNKYFKK
jgi:hypothetical protein